MIDDAETPEIASSIALLTGHVSRERPLSGAAEERILARLERAFEHADDAVLELNEVQRRRTVSRRPVTIAAVAAVLVLIGLSAAVLLNDGVGNPPANLPANASDPDSEDDRTAAASPIAGIRAALTSETPVELFRMTSDTEAYWRLTTLPEFDGHSFKLPSRPLARVDATIVPTGRTIRQHILISGLTDKLVPAAADVTQVAPNDDMRINPDTDTLVHLTDLVPGEEFTIVSTAPEATPDVLRASTTGSPPDDIFLGLPADLPGTIAGLAAEVTAGETTDYDRLMALQDWFLNNFGYSTDVQAGNGSAAIESFLQTRRGYCEQFAAAFAVMARTLGIPSRIAVGYTPGTLQSDGTYLVTGADSHAWPEIWFDGIGWIPFEPTPGILRSGVIT